MRHRRRRRAFRAAAWVLLAAAFGIVPPLAGGVLPVTLDGRFGDWTGVAPEALDPAGDGRAGGPDLGALWLANDAEALYLRLEVGVETVLQNGTQEGAGNALRLYLDLDADGSTGLPFGELGAEVEIRFGERRVILYDAVGRGRERAPGGAGPIGMPTHSATAFEISVPYDVAGAALGERLAGGAPLDLAVSEETASGDRLPDLGSLRYRTEPTAPDPPRGIDPALRRPARNVRLLSLNARRNTIGARPGLYRRLLAALTPDLVAFQEITEWSAEQVRELVAAALPPPNGGSWQAAQVADTVTVSSYPILAAAASDGNLVVHLDLPDARTVHDLVLVNAHTPCCGNEAGRDVEHDHLAALWRDLLAGRGPFPIAPRDALIMAGDFNMVGLRRQLEVLRDGVFIDPALGPDFAPGRGQGSLRSAPLRHTHVRTTYTWRMARSEFAPGKLDYVLYTGDVARLKKSFTLDTATLPRPRRRTLGLRRRDSERASDHLALVTDFRFRK